MVLLMVRFRSCPLNCGLEQTAELFNFIFSTERVGLLLKLSFENVLSEVDTTRKYLIGKLYNII